MAVYEITYKKARKYDAKTLAIRFEIYLINTEKQYDFFLFDEM